jgi:hypothetical protein
MKKLALLFAVILGLGVGTSMALTDKENIDAQKEAIGGVKKMAETTGDKELAEFSSQVEVALEALAGCVKNENMDGACVLIEVKKLADEGNPMAQHMMGNIYEKMNNYDVAIEWYQKALDNPKTYDKYKVEVQSDMDRAKKAKG